MGLINLKKRDFDESICNKHTWETYFCVSPDNNIVIFYTAGDFWIVLDGDTNTGFSIMDVLTSNEAKKIIKSHTEHGWELYSALGTITAKIPSSELPKFSKTLNAHRTVVRKPVTKTMARKPVRKTKRA